MRIIIALVLLLALGWSGYWLYGSSSIERGITEWMDTRRGEGWVAEGEVRTRGFPNRFDTTIENLQLADPATGVAWTAPFFQILALSYQPNNVIAVWPNSQMLAAPDQRLMIDSADMRGSLRFVPGPALELSELTSVTETLSVQSDKGWTMGADMVRFAAQAVEDQPRTYRLGLEATTVLLPEGVLRRLDPVSAFPQTITTLRIDSTVTFDTPWDRFAIERRRPQPQVIDLKELKAIWGDADLRAAGELTVGPDGVPEGEITIKAKNWVEMLDIAENSGILPSDIRPVVQTALQLIANLSGDPRTIDVPLTFENGRMSIGPVPIGRAPVIRLR